MKPRKHFRALTAAVTIGLAAFVAMSSCDGSSTGSSNSGNNNGGNTIVVGQDNAVTVPAGTEVRLDLTVSPISSYKITTSGSLATTVSVYTGSGLLLQSAPGSQGVSFSYSAAQQTTYTVVVKAANSGEAGAVLLNAIQTDGPDKYEPDNIRALATKVAADSTYQAHVLARNDTDWIKFDVKAGTSYKVVVNSSASLYSYIYTDSAISSYASNTSGGTLTYKPAANGRAFVMVTGYSSSSYGPYKILVYADTAGMDQYEPDDVRSQAKLITTDGKAQTHYLQAGEHDWLKFDAEAGKGYKIAISGASFTGEYYVYQDSTTSSSSSASGSSISVKATKTGRIFVDFDGYSSTASGPYSISVSPDTTGIDRYEPDDSRAQATTIATDGTVQSHYLQAGETDWLKFRADSGTAYKVTISNFSDGRLYLYPDSATSSYTTSGYSSASIKATKSGNIYVDFTGYSSSYSGSYGISVTIDTSAIDHYEPDNSRAQATLIPTNGTSQNHYLDPGENDWFKWDAQEGKAYRIAISNFSNGEMYVYSDSNSTTSTSSSSTSYLVSASKTGRMFMNFTGYYSSSTGAYSISIAEVVPQNLANASAIATDSTVVSRALTSSSDNHFYKFTADSGKVYALQTQGSIDTYLWLMAADSTVLTKRDDGGSSGSSCQKVAWLCNRSGTYYAGVHLYSTASAGNYTFTVTGHPIADFPDPSEPNSTQAQAYALTLGTPASLYFTSGDTDWVSIAAIGGTTYTTTFTSKSTYLPFVAQWVSSTGSVVSTVTSGGSFTPTTDGTYYLRLTPSTSTNSDYLGVFSAYTVKVTGASN